VSTLGPATPGAGGAAPGTLVATANLSGGQQVSVAVDSSTFNSLRQAQPEIAELVLVVNPAPVPQSVVQAGSVGGGVVIPAGNPVDAKLVLRDSSGRTVPLAPQTAAATSELVSLTLPVLAQPTQPGQEFAWLQGLYDVDGSFLGYIRPSGTFDPATGTVTLRVSIAQLQGTLFLPVLLTPAWVQNFDPLVRVWSGPTEGARNFGLAGPQFTTFTVVAPQIANRIFVYSPVVDNYGWIEAVGVGPSGPP
jgi:hypothetical protein